jgi:hypothetical protein
MTRPSTTVAKEHELKTWPGPFQAVLDGVKRYEIRVDDRGFAVGDVLHLREWVPHRKTIDRARLDTTNASSLSTDTTGSRFYVVEPHYTGRSLRVRVVYMTPGGAWGLPKNLCVMSIEPQERAA